MEDEEVITLTASWPVPVEWPLYVPIPRAAKIAGVSRELMDKWASEMLNPIPHIKTGRKKLIRVSAIPDYLQTKEAR